MDSSKQISKRLFCASASCLNHLTSDGTGKKYRVCVVGAGPAGFYTANTLLKKADDRIESIDFLERYPFPGGLVRYGVAPDHAETKNVMTTFEGILDNDKVRFLGNVTVGRDVTIQQLKDSYSIIVLSPGADSNRQSLPESCYKNNSILHPARTFVAWYNGHPNHVHEEFHLNKCKTAAIIGQGNVAIDLARILLKSPQELSSTDITKYALDKLQDSTIDKVIIVGRRGPAQAAFTIKEFREMCKLDNTVVKMDNHDMDQFEADMQVQKRNNVEFVNKRAKERIVKLIKNTHEETKDVSIQPLQKEFQVLFHRSPIDLVKNAAADNNGMVLKVQKMTLDTSKTANNSGLESASYIAKDGEIEYIDVDIVLESVGYSSIPIEGAPFNDKRCIIPNEHGVVIEQNDGSTSGGGNEKGKLYVSGWSKNGPRGVILTTKSDAEETAKSIIRDIEHDLLVDVDHIANHQSLISILKNNHDSGQIVSTKDWRLLKEMEEKDGKFVDIPKVLDILQGFTEKDKLYK